MFCSNCGKSIEDNIKFCPYCGAGVSNTIKDTATSQTTTKKKTKLPTIITFIIILLLILFATKKLNQNSKYDFLIKDVVSVQKDTIDHIDVASYLPDNQLYKEYTQEPAKNHPEFNVTKGYYFLRNDIYADYVFVTSSDGLNNYKYGCIYYDEEQDCLIEYNSKYNQRTLGQIGDRIEQRNGNNYFLETATSLFTVKTEAGTYKDCIAVISTGPAGDDGYIPQGVTFYAKGVGEVLYLLNAGIENDQKVVGKFFVNQYCNGTVTDVTEGISLVSALQKNRISYWIEESKNEKLDNPVPTEEVPVNDESQEITEAQETAETNDQNTPEEYAPEFELSEGLRYECFETLSGEDITVTIKVYESESSGTRYKAEFSDGKELWLEFSNTERDGRDYYYVAAADGVISFSSSDMIIEFNDEYYQSVNGTYINLPDADQVE